MTFLAGANIFLAAFLLFALEPLVGKRILPWFGGSAAVWSVCLVFYQLALLAGYTYARALTRYLGISAQVWLHLALLAASLALLPIGPSEHWKPLENSNPAWLILVMLTATIGLPFAVLAATSPLLQQWLAKAGEEQPFRFFAWSNFASLAALLAYPVLIEPSLSGEQQSYGWSFSFAAFAICCGAFAFKMRSVAAVAESREERTTVSFRQRIWWFALSACGSMLLLSITNHIDENVAAVPLLWVLPLGVYLLSFVVAFGSATFYRRQVWLRVLAFGLGMLAYAAYDIRTVLPIQVSVPVYLAGLFIGCVFCQGELYRLRPHQSALTTYYLSIAAGGATGAVFVGLVAPQIFGGIYELPLSWTLTASLALALTWQSGGWGARVLWSAVTICMAAIFVLNWQEYNANALALRRSFYGSLRVVQAQEAGGQPMRTLFHGTIQHGSEFTAPVRRMEPTTYYGQNSGIGILLREWPPGTKRVGVVGLGAGTLAAYAEAGDTFRLYELNPQVAELAKSFFYFLGESKAQIELVEGDARLSLEKEQAPPFDVLVLDAFSGDAIPVHLLTEQAMKLYLGHLKKDGVLAFHVSNNYLDLTPVIENLAAGVGYECLAVRNHGEQESGVLASEWVLVTQNQRVLDSDQLRLRAVSLQRRNELRIWTDDFNSLLPILKTPEIR